MEELYIESFLKKAKTVESPSRPPELIPRLHHSEGETSPQRFYQMIAILDELEGWAMDMYHRDEGLQFLFAKIKKKITEKELEGVIELITRLEELLDLGLPFLPN